ncbi:hypothetical protein KKC59_04855 [bacterium]|nr:hypothetical protein [bacterium]
MKIIRVSKNIGLKILSVIIAVIIWFYIMGDLGYKVWFLDKDVQHKLIKDVPVGVLQVSDKVRGNVVVSPKTIDVVVTGKKEKIEAFTKDQILAFVDISNFKEGSYSLIIKILPLSDFKIEGYMKTAKVDIGVEWASKKMEPVVRTIEPIKKN